MTSPTPEKAVQTAKQLMAASLASANRLLGEADLLGQLPSDLAVCSVSAGAVGPVPLAPLLVVPLCNEHLLQLLAPVPVSSLPEEVCFRGIGSSAFPRSTEEAVVLDIVRDGSGCRWFTKQNGVLFEVQSRMSSLSFDGYESVAIGDGGLKAYRRFTLELAPAEPVDDEPAVVFKKQCDAIWQKLVTSLVGVDTALALRTWGRISQAVASHGGVPSYMLPHLNSMGLAPEIVSRMVEASRDLPSNTADAQRAFCTSVLHKAERWVSKLFRREASKQRNKVDQASLERLLQAEVHPEISVSVNRSSYSAKKGTYEYNLSFRFRGTVRPVNVSSKAAEDASEAFDWCTGSVVRI